MKAAFVILMSLTVLAFAMENHQDSSATVSTMEILESSLKSESNLDKGTFSI